MREIIGISAIVVGVLAIIFATILFIEDIKDCFTK